MKNFGSLKMKMLKKLTDSYTKNEKNKIKEILNIIKENKDFKELYLLYEDIENKHFEDENVAKLYVEELSNSLKGKIKNVEGTYKKLEKLFDKETIEENSVYTYLDQLIESDSLLNLDKKVLAKKHLVDFLLTKKEMNLVENKTFTENESLLHAVLTNNFNNLYNSTLNEEQRNELKSILDLKSEEVESKMKDLKESVTEKINTLLKESSGSDDIISKLQSVKREVDEMKISKYNLYKLKELKNGL